jgi:hypothetical protein
MGVTRERLSAGSPSFRAAREVRSLPALILGAQIAVQLAHFRSRRRKDAAHLFLQCRHVEAIQTGEHDFAGLQNAKSPAWITPVGLCIDTLSKVAAYIPAITEQRKPQRYVS